VDYDDLKKIQKKTKWLNDNEEWKKTLKVIKKLGDEDEKKGSDEESDEEESEEESEEEEKDGGGVKVDMKYYNKQTLKVSKNRKVVSYKFNSGKIFKLFIIDWNGNFVCTYATKFSVKIKQTKSGYIMIGKN
jgi:hypothetical protein